MGLLSPGLYGLKSKLSEEMEEILKDPNLYGSDSIGITVYMTYDEEGYKKFVHKKMDEWKEKYDFTFGEDDGVDYSRVVGWHFSCTIPVAYVRRLAKEDFVKEIR